MGNCRVSIDELDNDIKQQADTDAMEARKASGAIEEIALAEYHKQLEDPQLMWEALGPDAFKGPYPNSSTIFCTFGTNYSLNCRIFTIHHRVNIA